MRARHTRARRVMVIRFCSPLSDVLALWSSHCQVNNRPHGDDSADPLLFRPKHLLLSVVPRGCSPDGARVSRCALPRPRREQGWHAQLVATGTLLRPAFRTRSIYDCCTTAANITPPIVPGHSHPARQSPLPSKPDSPQFPSTCSSLPLVFGCSNVAC